MHKLRIFLYARALVLTLPAYGLGWLVSMMFIDYQRMRASVTLIFLALRLTPFSSLLGLGLAVIFTLPGVWLASSHLTTRSPLTRRD